MVMLVVAVQVQMQCCQTPWRWMVSQQQHPQQRRPGVIPVTPVTRRVTPPRHGCAASHAPGRQQQLQQLVLLPVVQLPHPPCPRVWHHHHQLLWQEAPPPLQPLSL
jgi:hypothetical protein